MHGSEEYSTAIINAISIMRSYNPKNKSISLESTRNVLVQNTINNNTYLRGNLPKDLANN
jgi:hypothetical protein